MAQMNPYNIPMKNLTLICWKGIYGLKNFQTVDVENVGLQLERESAVLGDLAFLGIERLSLRLTCREG